MTAANLLIEARRLGVVVRANGPKLRVIPPDDVPPAEWAGLVEGLAEFKADVLAELASLPAWIDDPTLSIDAGDVRAILDEHRRLHPAG